MLAFLFIATCVTAQNYVLPEGEFMDTVLLHESSCRDGNYYYYQLKARYPKSSSTLLKEVQQFMKTKNRTYTGSGYITFRCRIGCNGKEWPPVQVLQTDVFYQPVHFEKELVNELFTYFQTLDNWKKAVSKTGEAISYNTYMSFKIRDGKVTDIIP